jgi:DNA-binding NarL/FixJ family response regulator
MIVEDEGVVSIDIRNMLKKAGYNIAAVAFQGEEAVTKAEQSNPDLVLMDIGLKGEIDGIEAAKRIRDRFKIPVVFLTGFSDDATMAKAQEVNPSGFIIKPINEEELNKILEDILKNT